MIPSLSFLITAIVLGAPAALILIPFALLTRWIKPLYVVGNWIARAAVWMAGVRVKVVGRGSVPKGRACIFMSNHLSNLDPPILLPLIPGQTSAFLKDSLMRIPGLGYAMRLGQFVPVRRSGNVESAQESIATASRVIAKGIHITTFVEGTRSKDGRMLPFKKGPFYLAKESGALCIPVSIYGTETMMAKYSLRIHPGTAHVVFHEAIDPANYATREDLLKAVRLSIASGLPEWMRN